MEAHFSEFRSLHLAHTQDTHRVPTEARAAEVWDIGLLQGGLSEEIYELPLQTTRSLRKPTFTNGASISFASRLAISVLPHPAKLPFSLRYCESLVIF